MLCDKKDCTLFHILVNCSFSLGSKRYNWRHDSVLRTIQHVVVARIQDQNKRKPECKDLPSIRFVAAAAADAKTSSSSRSSRYATRSRPSVLSHANDWQYLFDYDASPVLFPPSIYATDLRPDMVVWSEATRTLIIVELTVPSEDNIADAAFRKQNKYEELVLACRNAQWDVYFQTVEVGCRGFVAFSFRKCLKLLGISNPIIKQAISRASKTALRCSYLLYLARNNPNWKPLDLLYDSKE
jgi:hypothetical protein